MDSYGSAAGMCFLLVTWSALCVDSFSFAKIEQHNTLLIIEVVSSSNKLLTDINEELEDSDAVIGNTILGGELFEFHDNAIHLFIIK